MKKHFHALLWTLLFCLLLSLSSFAEDAPQVSDSDLLARARTLGILDGFSDESPEKPITRREFCVLTDNLLTSLGMTTGNPMRAPFEDTFDPAVMGLYVAGIVKGTSETTFSPDDTLIRADAACLTARTAAFCHVGLPEKAVTVPTEEIPDYAKHNVGLVMAYGLFVGTGNGFEPYEPYTVEQSATVLVRLYDLVKTARSEAFEDKLLSLLPKDKNFMVSPLSLKAALALAANGASDNTLDEILNTLGYPDLVSFNEAMQKALKAKSRETLVFETANSLWLNRDNMAFSFRKEYIGAMSICSARPLLKRIVRTLCARLTLGQARKRMEKSKKSSMTAISPHFLPMLCILREVGIHLSMKEIRKTRFSPIQTGKRKKFPFWRTTAIGQVTAKMMTANW